MALWTSTPLINGDCRLDPAAAAKGSSSGSELQKLLALLAQRLSTLTFCSGYVPRPRCSLAITVMLLCAFASSSRVPRLRPSADRAAWPAQGGSRPRLPQHSRLRRREIRIQCSLLISRSSSRRALPFATAAVESHIHARGPARQVAAHVRLPKARLLVRDFIPPLWGYSCALTHSRGFQDCR